MSFEIEQLLRPAASCAQRAGIPEPNDAAFAQAFADLLVGENLVDAAAISRARRAAEAADPGAGQPDRSQIWDRV